MGKLEENMLNLRRRLGEKIIIENNKNKEKMEIIISEINGSDVQLTFKDENLNYRIVRDELEK